jgi:transcription elongation GreA/GreB family factor
VTPHGLAQLRRKYEGLVAHHAQLKAAGEDFDKPKLTEIERDLRYFSQRLESAILVDVANEPKDEVHFGATVKAETDDGEVHEFTIVGEDEADVATGKVSWLSPLAKALIGAKEGDTVKWRRPAGDTELEIIDIQYPEVRGEQAPESRLQS